MVWQVIISSDNPAFVPSGNVYANAGNEYRIRKHARFCIANCTSKQITRAIDALATKAEMRPMIRNIFAEEYRLAETKKGS